MTIGSYILEGSWSAFSAIISTFAVVVALFGEKIRAWFSRPVIEIVEFVSIVPKSRTEISETVVYEHYLEVFHKGSPIENARFEVLEMIFDPRSPDKNRRSFPPALSFPLKYAPTLTTRDVVKIAEVSSQFELPKFPVDLGDNHPWQNRENDPHHRGRFYCRIIGKNYRSQIWPIDLVKDSNLSSGWRLEVLEPESEKSFFKRRRNYIREFNDKKRSEGLP